MSRIGRKPVEIPSGVTVEVRGREITAKGPKGQLSLTLVEDVEAALEDGKVTVEPRGDTQRARAMWGMQRTLISNLVQGVSQGFSKRLEISGVGYRAAVQGSNVQLQLGYSHDVVYPVPEGVQVQAERPTLLVVSGIDRQRVGQVAAEIRAYRPPEPYKGKGIKYEGEKILRKEGKKK
jgi:large subunit ribosomal protein L6